MADISLDVVNDAGARRAFESHPRVWLTNRYVYPVVSRRSKGISIGVNLNPDKVCNFDCIYCSVDRTENIKHKTRNIKLEGADVAQNAVDLRGPVDLGVLRGELEGMLEVVRSGEIYRFEPFDRIPGALRRVNDVAFSGDGEPTSCGNFFEACGVAAECLERRNAEGGMRNGEGIKIVVITNATLFHRARVREALAFLDRHNGEIWGKLDAGTEEYYRVVDRSAVPFERVLENLRWCCLARATVIQSLFMRVHGVGPPETEIAAYVGRLREIVAAGGRIKLVQVYTVARGTTEAYATALSAEELEGIARRVREGVGVSVEVYG
jgi:wyosine [tRNA(Phe)-imidazoG37] synthetase (radical SAM superfamily)